MGDLSYRTTPLGTAELKEILGNQAVGKPALHFHIELRLRAVQWGGPRPQGRFMWFGGEVDTPAGQLGLRSLVQEIGLFESEPVIVLQAALDEGQLRLLDEKRASNGSIEFVVHLRALIDGIEGVLPTYASCRRTFNQTHWLDVMRSANDEERFALESLIKPRHQRGQLANATAEFQKARKLFEERNMEPMLVACRKAFEHMPTPSVSGTLDREWDIHKRIEAAHTAIRHILHVGAHTGIGDPGDDEGRLAIAMTAAFLDYYNRKK